MHRLFISDLHLRPEPDDLNRAFRRWCMGPACDADEVWILGDLFEYWLGDDIGTQLYAKSLESLQVLAQNTPVHFICGNRDFLCGKPFAQQVGLRIHTEPAVLRDQGLPRVVLMHGDLLCTDDHDYQRYRAIVHMRWLQWLFVHTPRSFRAGIAEKIRERSQHKQQMAPATSIGDANPAAADQVLHRHRAQVLIHGHTHRPAHHQHKHGERYVLPDWRPRVPGSFGWLEQVDSSFGFRTLGTR